MIDLGRVCRPCLSLNTVCSSSLVALNVAVQNLYTSSCTSALVAGVNFIFISAAFYAYMSGNILAANGQCKTFDASANGIGRGEACGAIMLQNLSQFQSSHFLSATAVNQDGCSASMAAPNGPSQVDLIQRTAPRQSSQCSVETHGTGTPLGDPIEVGALHTVFSPFVDCIRIAAPKSHVSHTEGAAGIINVLKALLTLEHTESLPNLHLQRVNLKLDLDHFSLVMPTEQTAVLKNKVDLLFARGSSFGMSGTNAHAVFSSSRIAATVEAFASNRQKTVQYQQNLFSWWDNSDLQPSSSIESHIYKVDWQPVTTAAMSACPVKIRDFGTCVTSEVDASCLTQFTVCILGAGVTGIGIAGMLSLKGITNVMLDTKTNIGGLWHDGYHGLQLHSPSYHYQFIDLEIANDVTNDPEVIEKLLRTRRNATEQIQYFEEYAKLHELNFVPEVQGEIVNGRMVQLVTASKASAQLSFEWTIDARMAHINGGPTRIFPNAEALANRHLVRPKDTSYVVIGSGKSGSDAIIQLTDAGFENITWICAHKTGFQRRENMYEPVKNAQRNEEFYRLWFTEPLETDLGKSLDLVSPHDEVDCFKLGIVDARELAILSATQKIYSRVNMVKVNTRGSKAYLDDGTTIEADVVLSALGPNAHQTGIHTL
jgi:thioredoxin reductase